MAEDQDDNNHGFDYINVVIKEEIDIPNSDANENDGMCFPEVKKEVFEEGNIQNAHGNLSIDGFLNYNRTQELTDTRTDFFNGKREYIGDEQELTCTPSAGSLETRNDFENPSDEKNSGDIFSEQNKPFKCVKCQKLFLHLIHLKRHLVAHAGRDTPLKCPDCHKEFSQKSTVTRHLLIHSDSEEKRFKCPVCQKGFNDRSNVTRHLRTHSDEKPHKCEQCQESFKDKRLLTRHLKFHSAFEIRL